MNDTAPEIVEQIASLRQAGEKQFAKWNAAAFDAFVEGAFTQFQSNYYWQHENKPANLDVLKNLLQLIYQGVGEGLLLPMEHDELAINFFSYLLSRAVPNQLPKVAVNQQSAVLEKLWNLGEGMAREPRWLNQLAIAQTPYWSISLENLEEHIKGVLAPVVSPLPNATWDGRFSLKVHNLRDHSDTFVPGRVYLAAPAVLCLNSRIDPQETLAVLLKRGGHSQVLGEVGNLPAYEESFACPEVKVTANEVRVGKISTPTPLVAAPQPPFCTASGFIAITAEDSQRLWLVEAQ